MSRITSGITRPGSSMRQGSGMRTATTRPLTGASSGAIPIPVSVSSNTKHIHISKYAIQSLKMSTKYVLLHIQLIFYHGYELSKHE